MRNHKHSIEKELQILSEALNRILELRWFFDKYKLGWIGKTSEKYILEIIQEFYANYAATLENKTWSRNKKDVRRQLI